MSQLRAWAHERGQIDVFPRSWARVILTSGKSTVLNCKGYTLSRKAKSVIEVKPSLETRDDGPSKTRPPKRKRGATFTGDVREMLENALHECGGRNYLVWVAQRRPDVFCQLIGKIIPSESRLTVLAGYQAMPVPVEVREAIPALIESAAVLEQAPGEPRAGDTLVLATADLDDWGL